jgi:hypothetical protein
MGNIKLSVYKQLVSLNLVRRGNWLIKLSVYNGQILLIASHLLQLDRIQIKTFWQPEGAFDYIEKLLGELNE